MRLRRDDDGPIFFYKHRLSFRMGAHGTQSILGLSGGDLYEISRKLMAILAKPSASRVKTQPKGAWIATLRSQ